MNIMKDLILVNIFVISLLVLFQTENHIMALFCVVAIMGIYMIKHIRHNVLLKKEFNTQILFFEKLFNSSTDIIIYQDANSNIITCNDTLCKAMGKNKEEIIGNSLCNLFLDFPNGVELSEMFKEKIAQALNTKTSIHFFNEFIYNGNFIYNNLIFPAINSENEIVGYTIVARDVTKEFYATKEAQEKGTQLKCILENMPVCAYLKDIHDKFIIGSSTFEQIINNNHKDMKQLMLSDIFDKDYFNFIKKEEAEIYKTKQPLICERQLVFPNKTFWARIRKAPVLDENENVKNIVVTYEDIEAEKEIERQKEYFIETLIHDLKVPTLAQLRGLELIKNESFGEINGEQKELITQIEVSCKYILEMISMVLNTYRFETGQNQLVYEVFNISELVMDCFNKMSPQAQDKNIIFSYGTNKENTNIEADKEEIRQVILNLLSNAIAYSNKDERIAVNAIIENNHLKLTIVSRGVILSERECKTLFDRSNGEYPKYTTIGHGIGLYLCKKIIDMHNGEIYASTDGVSTNTFAFIIPQHKQSPTPVANSPMFI